MLKTFNLSLALDIEEYKVLLKKYQTALSILAQQVYLQQRPVTIVMEGWDTAGKSSAIRRITEKLDPRGYVVYAITSPKGIDGSQHYLRRFWKRLPQSGQIAIFDHSWYGRILNERINENCTKEEWKRAYREINSFERQMVDFGTIIFKFWLHIDQEEQIKRLENRSDEDRHSLNITGDDWRDIEKWDLYKRAVNDMLLKTSPVTAPWTVIESNSKLYARIKILRTLVDNLSQELNYDSYISAELIRENRKKKKRKK